MRSLTVLCLVVPSLCFAVEPSQHPIAEKAELLFEDTFERTDLGEWKSVIPTILVSDGVLRVKQTRDDHGAVGRVHRPMKNVIVEFKFYLDGSTGFNAVFDDQKFKGSHAGHICRVAFTPKNVRLGDDKEGVMRNDIFEMRRDPERKQDAEKLLIGRSSTSTVTVQPGVWYDVVIEIEDDRMRVCIDGKPVGFLQSPGIGHNTKSSLHFTVNGPGVLFDNVRIWNATSLSQEP